MKKSARWFWREWVKPLLVIALVVGSVRSAVADWNHVPTGSMKPTILEGDRVIVNKLAYDLKVPFTTWHLAKWGNPTRGDIVVFFAPSDGTRMVKRVVGLPGDTIALENNILVVNGKSIAYEPLETGMSNWIDAKERPAHQFAAEKLEDCRHAVMATPSLNAMRSFAQVAVPQGKYFMMGDNRDNSLDSRYFGSVPRQKIIGRAEAVAFSMDRDRYYLPRAGRFGEKL
ncbi:MAG: signal peptidase I [Verrucomicrobia bacterium]|nr:signal peptidase I [Verrucomicrobiota bacterium]